jgi:hypothetical protein
MPQLGAPRFKLADNNWHEFVKRLVVESQLIVMLAGMTDWLMWEMETVINAGQVTNLLLLFPRPLGFGSKRLIRAKTAETTLQRFDRVKTAFAGTKWVDALSSITHPEHLFAIAFDELGSITVVKGTEWTKDGYDLAVQTAYLAMRHKL